MKTELNQIKVRVSPAHENTTILTNKGSQEGTGGPNETEPT